MRVLPPQITPRVIAQSPQLNLCNVSQVLGDNYTIFGIVMTGKVQVPRIRPLCRRNAHLLRHPLRLRNLLRRPHASSLQRRYPLPPPEPLGVPPALQAAVQATCGIDAGMPDDEELFGMWLG